MVKHLTQCPESLQSKKVPSRCMGEVIFGSLERHFWHAWEGCRGANAAANPKLVNWGLRKDSRQLSIYQMTHKLNNIANQ